MVTLKLAANPRRLALAPAPALKRLIKPPALKMLPRRTYTKGMLLSGAFHAVVVSALIWLPILFPSPVIVDAYDHKNTEVASASELLILPSLPQITSSDSGSVGSADPVPQRRTSAAPDSAPLTRDYAGPQEIISDFPHATNRVQTIRRPDLVAPPELKFPLRLQSVIVLPAPAAPRFSPRRTEVQVPIPDATVALPKLVSVPQPVATVPAEPAPSTTAVQLTESSPVVELQPARQKAIIVVNAVTVAPDPAAEIPDAQLSGNFIVGPSVSKVVPEKSSSNGNGRPTETAALNNGTAVSQLYKGGGAGTDMSGGSGAGSAHSSGASNGNIADAGTGIAPVAGSGSGTLAAARGNGNSGVNGSGAPGSSGAGGISISGGSPGRNGGLGSRSAPMSRSYGMTIISGGSSGGAGRDMGVFDRNETVFSVAIPMGDAGGGPDWPMQYAMLNHGDPGAGLLVPPFAQKKVAATIHRTQLAAGQGPVFVSGVIDETGKLQSLRSIRAQDARSQPAIQALQQWQFLPAQLDGRPVASKVLIGVTVTVE